MGRPRGTSPAKGPRFIARDSAALWLYHLETEKYKDHWPYTSGDNTVVGIADELSSFGSHVAPNTIGKALKYDTWFETLPPRKNPAYYRLTRGGKTHVAKLLATTKVDWKGGECDLSLVDVQNRLKDDGHTCSIAVISRFITEGVFDPELMLAPTDGTTPTSGQSVRQGATVLEVLAQLGITTAGPYIDRSEFEPLACAESTKRRLDFMGIMGAKWVEQHYVRAAFKDLLERAEKAEGLIRFLLLDPASESFTQLHDERKGAISSGALQIFAELAGEFDSLQVRLFDHYPRFRLTIVDERRLSLAGYRNDPDGYRASNFGHRAPYIVMTSGPEWSLFGALSGLFEDSWRKAKPMKMLEV